MKTSKRKKNLLNKPQFLQAFFNSKIKLILYFNKPPFLKIKKRQLNSNKLKQILIHKALLYLAHHRINYLEKQHLLVLHL